MKKAIRTIAILAGLMMTVPLYADTITIPISVPNTALSILSGPYAELTVDLTDATHADITFESLTSGNYIFLLAGENSVVLNVNATGFEVIGGISGVNYTSPLSAGFSQGYATSIGSGNMSEFGDFNLTIKSFDGFSHSATEISFVLLNNSGTWSNAAAVLTENYSGYLAGVHGFATNNDPLSSTNSVLVTGFAANGGGSQVPEPASLLLLGMGLVGVGFASRKRK